MPPWKKTHKTKLKDNGGHLQRSVIEEPLFLSRQTSINPDHMQKEERRYNQITINPVLTSSVQYEKKKVDISVIDQNGQQFIIPDIEIHVSDDQELMLGELIQDLKRSRQSLYFEGCIISVLNSKVTIKSMQQFGNDLKVYTYCGPDPLREDFKIKMDTDYKIEIKLTSTKSSLLDQLLKEQNINRVETLPDSRQPRVKERKIYEVIQKVALWRRFYTGFYDENRKFVQMPLDKAAEKVDISKKTLDDYLLQIRCGKRYGFDFNRHKDERIGKLRTYVKDRKKSKP